MAKPLTQDERQLARKFRRCLRESEVALLHFKEADRLLDELLKEVDTTKDLRLTRKGKKVGRFRNNYAKSNTCFRPKAIKLYEPEIIELS